MNHTVAVLWCRMTGRHKGTADYILDAPLWCDEHSEPYCPRHGIPYWFCDHCGEVVR